MQTDFRNKNRSEVLDITLSSSDIFSFIKEWKVTDIILTSDHKCICFKLDLDSQPPLLFRNRASTNWETFLHLIEMKLNSNTVDSILYDCEKLDEEVDKINNIITESYEKACPLHKHKSGQSVPYYASEDRRRRTELRKAFNNARSPINPGTWDEFYNLQRIYKNTLKKKERVGWKEQCTAINSLHDSAKIFKILSKDPIQLIGSLQLPSGNYTDTLDETYEQYREVLESLSPPNQAIMITQKLKTLDQLVSHLFFLKILEKLIDSYIRDLARKTCTRNNIRIRRVNLVKMHCIMWSLALKLLFKLKNTH